MRPGGLYEINDKAGLTEVFERLRLSGSRKMVLILDQFEQWLHARSEFAGTELVGALRQCDGVHVQAVVLVRDDFWLAVSRFLKELEVPLVEGHNSALIDLFDVLHARNVLAEFGRAYGRLPADLATMSPEQQCFLDDAVSGLARDGKVVSVRLALFAEMVKGKPWTKETLRQLGGTEGVGLTFLEETLGADSAPPEHRLHQKAARAVLQTLLPEEGTNIKGHMRSHEELLQASEYGDRLLLFGDVLRLLDQDLRLITPIDPSGLTGTDSNRQVSRDNQLYYQLTHDYMVPALRRWLTRKQMETPQGRAALRLSERAALWSAKPENQRLPDWQEFVNIRRLTDRHTWTDSQRRMMRQAGRHHAQALVRGLLEANLSEVPQLARQISQIRRFSERFLRQEQQAAQHGKVKLHTALALLPMDPTQLDYLYERLLQAEPADFPILRDALSQYKEPLSGRLWSDAAVGTSEERRLRAAAALARYEPVHPHWQTIRADVAEALTRVSPEFLGHWKEALRPMRGQLLGPLGAIFRNQQLGELQIALATATLADYAADNVDLLADLLNDANPQQFAGLFPVLARHEEDAIRLLERELDKVAQPDWADNPTDPAWPEVPSDTRQAVEAAAGVLEAHFAFCQAMPSHRFGDVLHKLGESGYRPLRIRPHRVGSTLQFAAVWARDDHRWQWQGQADVEQLLSRDAVLRREGYAPIDVAVVGSLSGSLPCYTAVWERAEADETETRLMVGALGEEGQRALTQLVAEKFNCQIANVVFDDLGKPHACTLWTRRKEQQKSTTRVFHGPAHEFHADHCPGLLLTDAQWSQSNEPDSIGDSPTALLTAVWNVSTKFESKVLHAMSAADIQVEGRRLAVDGYRPIAITVAAGPHTGPLATSVWHRQLIPEEVKDRLAKHQANAAVALLRLKRERKVWGLLGHLPDPRARSYLIHRFSPLDADWTQVERQLDVPHQVSIRRALILILGEFNQRQLPPDQRARLTPRLLELYANDPDPGIHGATAWTLRQWDRQSDLRTIDQRLASVTSAADRHWYVNRQGQTLAIIPGPGRILIGSPPYESGREGGPEDDVEMQHYVQLDHTFALMTHTVTVTEFLRFRKDYYYRNTFSPEPDCPINNLNWYEAAAYCNWLNEQEDIPQHQWCYLPNEQGEYAQGMRIVPNCLHRTGYRLPTEAEWEYACRAGSITSRYYGQSPDLDNHYAWTVKLALGRGTTSVGRFKPNEFGMFDMMGNIMEWIHDAHPDHSNHITAAREVSEPEPVNNQQMRALRPSCYTSTGAEHTRSAARGVGVPPNARVLLHALRVSRTLAMHDRAGEDTEVRDEQRRVIMGAPVMHSSGFIRSSYRSRGYSPNFRLFAWGIRPARTVERA